MTINFENIQGNIFGGFNKDFQDFFFLEIQEKTAARAWIRANASLISTSEQVIQSNKRFKQFVKLGVANPEAMIAAKWVNIAFSFAGLETLGFTAVELGKLPQEFTSGMASRAEVIGDKGASAPKNWTTPFDPANQSKVHAILIVAADIPDDLTALGGQLTATPAFKAAFRIIGKPLEGRTRLDEIGHEHFGFKDGVSQPGIRGVDGEQDPFDHQGNPGQDLLWPGEFVLGYPAQKTGRGSESTDSKLEWTNDGSFLVFRRLEQDVPGFHAQLGQLAKQAGLSVDTMGAKMVGRYRSGCPIELQSWQTAPQPVATVDPGIANPALANDPLLNNDFEYGNDPNGERCPLSAHIRKAYPRDEETGASGGESETQTHRLLRRGIPYGRSYGLQPDEPRGLLFLAYQASIDRQFEFVQAQWVNNPSFPPVPSASASPVAGEDPIIAQSPSGSFLVAPGQSIAGLSHFVKTTGGEYFFAPSLTTLRNF